MLWVAAGKQLPPKLMKHGGHVAAKGWAIESRVYAEDPLRNFLPSIGPLVTYKEPPIKSGRGHCTYNNYNCNFFCNKVIIDNSSKIMKIVTNS